MVKHEFSNFGFIKTKVPDNIISYIKNEVNGISQSSEDSSGVSGVAGAGTMTHYNFKDSSPLKDYILNESQLYLKSFGSAIDYKLRSDGINPKSLFAYEPWINIQKKTEWLPPHDHAGFISYTIWVSLPEESKFEFIYNTITGDKVKHVLELSKEDEGQCIIFPAKILHCVHPFFTDDTRITVAGNLGIKQW